LEKVIFDSVATFQSEALFMLDEYWQDLACVLVEFAEDLHNDIGIWRSLENYHYKFFKTKLPLTPYFKQDENSNPVNSERIHHLLWVLIPEYKSDLILSPSHNDLIKLTQRVSIFLKERFSNIPKDSGIKKFFAQSDKYGWDVKRKLIWLGKHSYLFRDQFYNYLEDREENDRIAIVDDFVNQQTTSWSGLGVIDILAATLNISDKQRKELRSWYERHLSFYKILSSKDAVIEALNIINDKNYTIRVGDDYSDFFEINEIVFGSLVPWNKEWYWSGAQKKFHELTQEQTQQIKKEFIIKSPGVAYRYDASLLKQAKESLKKHHNNFVEFKGKDFVIYPNGRSMADDLKKCYQFLFKSVPDNIRKEHRKKYNLPENGPRMSLPQEIIEFENGVGLFYNPDEGQEIMLNFNDLISGMKKHGDNLNEIEEDTIRGFITSDAISPRFVRIVTEEYGSESIAAAFLIRDIQNEYYLDYLLRRYKGHYFRNRYPAISLVI